MTFLHALPIAFLVVFAVATVVACVDLALDGLIERAFPSRFLDGPTSSSHYCHLFTFEEGAEVITPVCADCGRRRPGVVRT